MCDGGEGRGEFCTGFRSTRRFLCDIIEEHEDNVDGEHKDDFMGKEGEYEQKLSLSEEEQREEEGKGNRGIGARLGVGWRVCSIRV